MKKKKMMMMDGKINLREERRSARLNKTNKSKGYTKVDVISMFVLDVHSLHSIFLFL